MLRLLHIANLAVIDQLQIEFRPGLNVLSGETGSGKSIIVDALGLLLGERAAAEMIRTGEARAFVEGVFGVEGNLPLLELLAGSGIEPEGEEIVIKRELSAQGRSRIFVNHQAATLGLLRTIQPHLIDIHGQGDQQSLLSPEVHLNLLDAFAGAGAQRREVEEAYERLLGTAQSLEAAQRSEAERLQLLDLLAYQIAEIEGARLEPEEDARLEAERQLLANAARLATLAGEAYRLLYEDDPSALAQIGAVQRRVNELAEVDARLEATREQLAAARYALEDAAFTLRDYGGQITFSPARLKAVEERLLELDRLRRKYGGSVAQALRTLAELRARREELQGSEERARALRAELETARAAYRQAAAHLSRVRRARARAFEQAAVAELAEVALERARFAIRFGAPAGAEGLSRAGAETAEFCFSANAGEDLRPLGGVASGGELSRLMLVLKTITAPTLFPRTLIFDEVDAGIGGRVAEAVGQRLRRLAATNQVLCVTHQAPIARYADAHFQVTKEVQGARTITRVEELSQSGRVAELARMIGGAELTARKHARELLKARR
jgi:DNA repair protein RecN (Recombination protein N)